MDSYAPQPVNQPHKYTLPGVLALHALHLNAVESLSGIPALNVQHLDIENLYLLESEKQSSHCPVLPSGHEAQSCCHYKTTTVDIPQFVVWAHESP
jgi:hypothetical protein